VSAKSSPVVAHADLDCFFAAAEILRRPELEHLPVAVAGPGSSSVVATANYPARAFGVHSAMSVSSARRLCKNLVVVEPDFAWYRSLSLEVMAAMTVCSTIIEPVSFDEAYLAFDELVTFDNAAHRAQRIRADVLARTGLVVSVGMAPTRTAAKLASGAAKPDGFVVITPEGLGAFLSERSLEDLPGLGPATLKRLDEAGVRTVDALIAMPVQDLRDLVGVSLATYLTGMVNGTGGTTVAPPARQTSVSTEHTIDHEVTSAKEFTALVREAAVEATARLTSLGLGARGVTLKVRSADFTDVSKSHQMPAPTSDPAIIMAALRALLEPTFRRAGGRVRLIGVGLTGLTETIQLSFNFADPAAVAQNLDPVPVPGSRVRHRMYGLGTIALSAPDAAIVRFDDEQVRVIATPRDYLTRVAT
jgi:DNA polymerase-4